MNALYLPHFPVPPSLAISVLFIYMISSLKSSTAKFDRTFDECARQKFTCVLSSACVQLLTSSWVAITIVLKTLSSDH